MSKSQTIATIIQNGILFDVKNWGRLLMDSANQLPNTVEELFTKLAEQEIDYLVVGGIALLSYIEGRNTQDLDLILAREDVDVLEMAIQEENQDFARCSFGDLQVDLLLTRNPLFKQIRERYSGWRNFGGREVNCATVEGLLLLKLYALPSLYRQGLFNKVDIYQSDIRLLLRNYSIDPEPLLNVLKPHLLQTDLETVREIVVEIKVGIDRDRDRQKRFGQTDQ
jgi:hypothetical protein